MNAPREPQGAGSLVGWLRILLRYVRSLQIQSGRGYKVKRGPYGTILEIDRGGGGGISDVETCNPDTGEME
jgi:hypothetical protein